MISRLAYDGSWYAYYCEQVVRAKLGRYTISTTTLVVLPYCHTNKHGVIIWQHYRCDNLNMKGAEQWISKQSIVRLAKFQSLERL